MKFFWSIHCKVAVNFFQTTRWNTFVLKASFNKIKKILLPHFCWKNRWQKFHKNLKPILKVPLSGPRQFEVTKSLLKTMKNAFYFILKAFLFFFQILPWLFGHVNLRLDKKFPANFKIYEVINLKINNCNTHLAQYLKK